MGDRARSTRTFCEGGKSCRCQDRERRHYRRDRGRPRCKSFTLPGEVLTDNFTGQFYDVVHLLSLTGEPSSEHILLMNGDLVDRGSWSIEVILTAFAFKCWPCLDFIRSINSDCTDHRATPQEHVHQSRKPRSKGNEPNVRI